MLRLAAAASALAIATVALSFMQAPTLAYAQANRTGAGCERQASQDAGDLQARPNTQRAFNAFATFGDIKGESTNRSGSSQRLRRRQPQADEKHKDEIHIESFSWGQLQSTPTNSSSPSQRLQTPSAPPSQTATASLMLSCAAGKH
jgi:hypothetical protein